jgi:hypothetical protein
MRDGFLWVAVLASGCALSDEMGPVEALQTLSEVNRSSQGEQATQDVVEISTDFTIGEALEAAARSIADFWQSQVPCTTVTVDGATTTVDYGTLDDACVYQGRTYAGVNTVTVGSTEPGALEVDHTWTGFTNGDVTVDGAATVTWDGLDASRTVVTEHAFTLADDPEVVVDVQGEHVTRPLEGDAPWWESGFTLDGTRTWSSDGSDWFLTMSGLELRMIDPCPQAGVIEATAPSGRSLTLTYARVDEDTISTTLSGVRGGDRVYHVNRLGLVEEAPAE